MTSTPQVPVQNIWPDLRPERAVLGICARLRLSRRSFRVATLGGGYLLARHVSAALIASWNPSFSVEGVLS